jgi:hypothetical protein
MYRVGVAAALGVLTACALAAAAAGDGRRVEREGGADHAVARGEVTYDGRALVVDGTRRMLFSGEIHYTRSTPEVCAYSLQSFLRLMQSLLCISS